MLKIYFKKLSPAKPHGVDNILFLVFVFACGESLKVN